MVKKILALSLFIFLMLPMLVTANIQEFELNELYNNTGTNSSVPTFNFRVLLNESSLSVNCTLLINDTGYGINSSVVNNTETNITSNSSFSDGLYTWSMNCTTNDFYNIETYTRLFWIDTQLPNVTLVEPTPNESQVIEATNSNFIITVNSTYSDNSEIIACVMIRNTVQHTMSVFDGYCLVDNTEWTEGQNIIKVRAFDKGGNYADTSQLTFTYNAITRIDQNPLLVIIPLIFIVAAALIGIFLVEYFGHIDTKEAVYMGVAAILLAVFSSIIIMFGGVVI